MNIIITGASRGIGYETAKILSKEHKVIGIARSIAGRDFKSQSTVIPIAFDFEKGNIKKDLLPQIKKHFDKVDVLINNAATFIKKSFEEISQADFEKVFQVNFFSIAELTQAILASPLSPLLKKRETRVHVLNIASMGGIQGTVKFPGLSAYTSSKGALITLTECLAEEYKDKNISFNAIAFGAVQTEMLSEAFPKFKAPITAEEAAKFVAQFAITGQNYFNGKVLQMALSTP